MTGTHAVQTCRWGSPTLLLPWPFWYNASQHEWSCTRGATASVLVDPSVCRTCPYWAPQERQRAETRAPGAGRCRYERALVRRNDADERIPIL